MPCRCCSFPLDYEISHPPSWSVCLRGQSSLQAPCRFVLPSTAQSLSLDLDSLLARARWGWRVGGKQRCTGRMEEKTTGPRAAYTADSAGAWIASQKVSLCFPAVGRTRLEMQFRTDYLRVLVPLTRDEQIEAVASAVALKGCSSLIYRAYRYGNVLLLRNCGSTSVEVDRHAKSSPFDDSCNHFASAAVAG